MFFSSLHSSRMPVFCDFDIDVIRKNRLVEQYLNVHDRNGFEEVLKEVFRVCETTVLFGSLYQK